MNSPACSLHGGWLGMPTCRIFYGWRPADKDEPNTKIITTPLVAGASGNGLYVYCEWHPRLFPLPYMRSAVQNPDPVNDYLAGELAAG